MEIKETLYNFISKKKNTVSDLSAAVTGLLLAFCLPVTVPYWLAVIALGGGALVSAVIALGGRYRRCLLLL